MTRTEDPVRFLRSLRTVRRYADRPIDRAVLDEILEVGRWTGSGKNRQPWEVVLVQDRTVLSELARCGGFASHLAEAAMATVLVMADATRQFDEGRLAHNLMLAAWAHGIGSCMSTFSSEADVQRGRELLGVPESRWMRHSIAFGYPEDRLSADGKRSCQLPTGIAPGGRKPMDSFVHWERFGNSAA